MATAQIVKINEAQLMDYISCPVYYDLKYNSKLNFQSLPTMNKLLNQVVYSFAANMMNDRILEPHNLKVKWDGICRRNNTYVTDARAREGMGEIIKFYNWAAATEINIVDVGEQYVLRQKLTNDLILEYEGYLDIIAVHSNKKALESVRISFSKKNPEQALLDLNLKISLDHVGFDKLYKHPLIGTRIHHIKTNKDFYTTRDVPSEKTRCYAIIRNVYLCIRNKLFYPRENPLCVNCQAKDFCKGWQDMRFTRKEAAAGT